MDTVDGEGLVWSDFEGTDVELVEMVLMDDAEFEGNPHEPREFLHSLPYFFHDLDGRGFLASDHGSQAEMRGVVASGGQGF